MNGDVNGDACAVSACMFCDRRRAATPISLHRVPSDEGDFAKSHSPPAMQPTLYYIDVIHRGGKGSIDAIPLYIDAIPLPFP